MQLEKHKNINWTLNINLVFCSVLQGSLFSGAQMCQAVYRTGVCRQNNQHQKVICKR